MTVKVTLPIWMVPVRGATAVLRATEYATAAAPLPEAPAVTAIQSAPLAALHAQESGAMTVKEPVAASFEKAADPGETEMLHAGAPSCRTGTACPAIVNVPDRWSTPVFAVRATATEPGPLAAAPLVIVIQPRSEAAVHAHAAVVETATEPVDAVAPNVNDVGDSVKAQDAGGGVGSTGDLPSQAPAITRTANGSAMRQALRGIAVSAAEGATALPARTRVFARCSRRSAGTAPAVPRQRGGRPSDRRQAQGRVVVP
jgi:hypothetical protein